MTKFTSKEQHAINRAFDYITAHLDCVDWSFPNAWRNALKLERRECSNATAAKALMVEQFSAGVRQAIGNQSLTAAELFRIRPGAREAYMVGAALWTRAATHQGTGSANARQYIRDDLMALCDLSNEAKQAAFHRRADEIQGGTQ